MSELIDLLNSVGAVFVGCAGRMLIQSSLLIAVLFILDLALRGRVKAVVRYWLWLLILAKLVLPPSLSSPTGILGRLGDQLPNLPERVESIVREPPAARTSAIGVAEQSAARMGSAFGAVAAVPDEPGPPVMESSEVATGAVLASPAPSVTWQAAVLLAWAVVVMVMLVLLSQRAAFVRSLMVRSQEAPETMMVLLSQCRQRMKMGADVGLRLSSLSLSPSVCGLWRPVILVPEGMLDQFSPAQWRSILLHELAHIKRRDLWANLAQTLLQIAYFFHPLLWAANAMIRRVREQAVDETVLAALGEDAEEYPKTLLSVSRLAFGRPALSLRLLGVVESKKALTARIKFIVSRPFPKSARLGFLGLVLVVVVAAVLLPMASAESGKAELPGDVSASSQGVVPPDAAGAGGEGLPVPKGSDSAEAQADQRPNATQTIEGIVVDELGRPRQCARVAAQGQDLWRGAMSDVNGRFRVENVQADQRIWIAYSQASRLYGLFRLPETPLAGPVRAVLNLGEADLEGRVVGADGKALSGRRVEITVTTTDGIRFALDHRPQTDAYGYYSHGNVPCGQGLVMEVRLADEADASFSTGPVTLRANQFFIEMPVLVAAREKTQPDFDRNVKDDGMLHCGGRVIDEGGRPIPNVRVRLSFDMPGYMAMWVREAVTDERGRWRRPVPPECMDLAVEFEHPEHYGTDSRSKPPREELTGGTHVAMMKRGLVLEGTVNNEQGEPVENALVCAKPSYASTPSPYNQTIEDSTTARTLRDGTFRIRGLPPGARTITVYSDHHAPAMEAVDIREGMPPARVTLTRGRTYRGQVVDGRGNPLEGVRIGIDRWELGKEYRRMSRISTTDAQGMVILENLPQGQIGLDVSKKEFLGFSMDLPQDVTQLDRIVMYEVPVFRGRVLDADTNEPVTEFHVVNGIRWDAGEPFHWSRHYGAHVKDPNGVFTHRWGGYGFSYPAAVASCIKVKMEGYVPSAPVLLELGQTCEPLTVRLKKGIPVAGAVLQPDGRPAAKAQVAFVRRGEKAFVDRDQFSARGYAYQAEIAENADAVGRFELPPTGESGLIVAVHASGYAQVPSTDFADGSAIRLTAWSRVEGAIDRARIGEKEVEIALRTLGENADKQAPCIHWLFDSVAPTSDTFALDCVPAVPLAVGRLCRYEMHDAACFVPQPGKTQAVQIGAAGRPVTGRIVPPDSGSVAFTDPRRVHAVAFRTDDSGGIPASFAAISESSFTWLWRDKGQVYAPSTTLRKRFIPTIADDGSFTFSGLEPGRYEFIVNAHAPLGENVSCGRGVLEAVAVSRFTIADGATTSTIRLPDIRLQLLAYPRVGERAPLFEVKALDGTTVRLQDLRGKVVLLDFWATWCKPCVAQLPQVQQLYETFRDDDRFALIGLSLDWDIEKARSFLAGRQLKWPQVSLGDMDTSPIVKQYGVGSIPTMVLIDAEGRIAALDIPIDQLQEHIRRALTH